MCKGMLLFAACVSLLLPSIDDPVHAAPVTFVSGNGNDSNDCLTPATACRELIGFTGAIEKTDRGGTVHVLPGAYNYFGVVSKSVNILADQGQASIKNSVSAVTGTLGRASMHIYFDSIVRIRGFTFSNNDSGIAIYGDSSAVTVYIENCTFKTGIGVNNAGIEMATNGPAELYVSNSIFQGPGNGIFIQPRSGGSARVVLNNVSIENSNAGLWLDARATNGVNRVTVKNTAIGNGGSGLLLIEDATGSTSVAVENTSISNGGTAFLANGPTITARVQDSMIVNNAAGLAGGGGAQVISHGGNVLFGNGNNGAFTSTVAPQ